MQARRFNKRRCGHCAVVFAPFLFKPAFFALPKTRCATIPERGSFCNVYTLFLSRTAAALAARALQSEKWAACAQKMIDENLDDVYVRSKIYTTLLAGKDGCRQDNRIIFRNHCRENKNQKRKGRLITYL